MVDSLPFQGAGHPHLALFDREEGGHGGGSVVEVLEAEDFDGGVLAAGKGEESGARAQCQFGRNTVLKG
jgi:hypothetical protein